MKKLYSIISHTHWDREWYLPFEQFRIRLVDMMDNLIDILKKDKKYRFHLDAQTIVIEDYLEIRPKRRQELEDYVKEGRLLVGPWYVQNDFHLVSGEATVRNLLIGRKIARELGDRYSIGYAADQFGLCSQLPQMLNGFGIDSLIFGRGYGRGERQFYWECEDGSRVLCEHMKDWYNNLQRLPEDPSAAIELTRARAEACFEKAKGSSALLMNGVDHLEAQENLTKIIDGMNALKRDDEEIIQDTLPDYIARLKKEIEELGIRLECYSGEMRDCGQASVLTGTLSSRIHLKQHNVRTQSAIEGVFEPQYASLDALGIKDYPLDWSEYLWKTLIKNHPHDSICGCSTDAVHRHMEDRTSRLLEALEDLTFRADDAYMQHLDRTDISDGEILITCINNSLYTYDGIFEADIDILCSEDKGSFTLKDCRGKAIFFEVVKIQRSLGKRILSPINLPGVKLVNRYTVRFRTKVCGMSRKTLICTPTDGAATVAENAKKRASILENEFLKVTVNKNGSINIINKKNGIVYKNALIIEDNSDNSDNALYCYRLGGNDDICTSENAKARIEVVNETKLLKSRKISYVMNIRRGENTYRLPVELLLTLKSGSDKLYVSTMLDNTYPDHRVRVYLPTGILSDINYAAQPFDIVKRKKISDFKDDEMHPNSALVGIDGDGHGIAILNKGLYEYEHLTDENGTLALTLLRSAGCIGKYMAGAETPEGQCIGKYTLDFAIYPYCGNMEDAAAAREADFFINPPYTATQHKDFNKFVGGRPFVQAAGVPQVFYREIERPEVVIPLEKTLIELTQSRENAMMLSAFKGAEDGTGQIIRLYNTTSERVSFSLKMGYKISRAYLCNLAEEPLCEIKLERGRKISLEAKPKQIITLKLVL